MGQYEVRRYVGWYRYITLTMRSGEVDCSLASAAGYGRRLCEQARFGLGEDAAADKASGTVHTVEEAADWPISHPRCRRAFGPPPDSSGSG
ncbi:hypothetical protein [Streptomyces sp. NPDC017958]|uniref:hypothetical protein n=1 Tax=Streptomyces sp. NPDC017958 TaxID=3365021 RepID=UPI00379B37A3